VRKIEIQHEQKQDRSLSRKYKNESQLKNLEAGLGTIVPISTFPKGSEADKQIASKDRQACLKEAFYYRQKITGKRSVFGLSN
jgi:hypothetical protein